MNSGRLLIRVIETIFTFNAEIGEIQQIFYYVLYDIYRILLIIHYYSYKL